MTPDDLARLIARAVTDVVGAPWTPDRVVLRRVTTPDATTPDATGVATTPRATTPHATAGVTTPHADMSTPVALDACRGADPAATATRIARRLAGTPGIAETTVTPGAYLDVRLSPDAWRDAVAQHLDGPGLPHARGTLGDELAATAQYLHARACATLQGARDMHLAYDPRTADVTPALDEVRDVLTGCLLTPRTWRTAHGRPRPVASHVVRLCADIVDLTEQHPPLPRGDEEETVTHHSRLLVVETVRVTLHATLVADGSAVPERV